METFDLRFILIGLNLILYEIQKLLKERKGKKQIKKIVKTSNPSFIKLTNKFLIFLV